MTEGGSFSDAIPIARPTFTETRSVEEARSVYYKFRVDEGRSFDVELEDNRLTLMIYNPDRSEKHLCQVSGSYKTTQFAEFSGYHYVEVQCPEATRYTVTIRVAQPIEPGLSFGDATEIIPGVRYEYGSYENALGGVEVPWYAHYYKFYAGAGKEIRSLGIEGLGLVLSEREFLDPNRSHVIWKAGISGWYRLKIVCDKKPVYYSFGVYLS